MNSHSATAVLHSGFLRSAEKFPNRPALDCEGSILSYSELKKIASSICATLEMAQPNPLVGLTAVLGDRSTTTYAAILAVLFRGHGYVPLSPSFPVNQLRYIIEKTGCESIIIDGTAQGLINDILVDLEVSLLVILPESESTDDLRQRWPHHQFLGADDIEAPKDNECSQPEPNATAFVMFTSGSTGHPKGVSITHRNIFHLLQFAKYRYNFTEDDRFSQMFPLTFDLSVFDIFAPWECGACICYPSTSQTLSPGTYINDAKLTIWYANPSILAYLKSLGSLEAGGFPDLRLSLYCGEALPAELMMDWIKSAPNAVAENLYGPTELTLTCLYYRWNSAVSGGEVYNGIVPIGYPHPLMDVLIVDDDLKNVSVGEAGELLMSGPQMSQGYLGDAAKTRSAFIQLPVGNTIYYRTGDRVRQSVENGPIQFLGRKDNQVQIHGARVEPGEVEAAIRKVADRAIAVVLGWPVTDRGVEGLVAFINGIGVDAKKVRRELRSELPSFMIPRKIFALNEFPLNSNGKIDRGALLNLLKEGDSQLERSVVQ